MSLRKAINAKCKDCIYDECAPGTWRQQVSGCSFTDCSLWPVRPRAALPRSVLASQMQPIRPDPGPFSLKEYHTKVLPL